MYARALDVATTFDLTITEKKVREEMLGEKGKLTIAVKDLEKASPDVEKDRYLVRDALQYLNENVDTNYWILSMNTLTSVLSAILLGLGICMIIFVPGLDPAKAMVPPKMGLSPPWMYRRAFSATSYKGEFPLCQGRSFLEISFA